MTSPLGWVSAPLGEVADLALGKMLDRTKRVKGSMHPYLRNVNVRWGGFNLSDVLQMPFEEHEHERYSIEVGDVLICEGGEPGRAAVWTDPGIEIMFQKALHRVRPGEGLDPRWLVLHLRKDALSGNLEPFFSGTTIKHFTGVSLSRYPVLLPPLAEQRRIISKIECLAERCGRARKFLEEIPPLLEQLRRAILASAFRGDLTADWREKNPNVEPASELLNRIRAERRRIWEEAELERMRARGKAPADDRWKAKYEEPGPVDESELPELPEGWVWATAQEVCQVVTNGDTPPASHMRPTGDVPFIKIGNLTKTGALDFLRNPTFIDRELHANALKRSNIVPGDVLMNIVGPPLGKVSIVPDDYPEWNTNQAVVLFRPAQGILSEYLAMCLLSESVIGRLTRTAKATAGQFNISLTACRSLALPVPPEAEQRKLASQWRNAWARVEVFLNLTREVLGQLEDLDRAILAKAFRGELVPQDPNDEPASVLLERIRTEREAAERERKESGSGRRPGRGRPSSGLRSSRSAQRGRSPSTS